MKLERRRLLAAGIVTAAGAFFGAGGPAQAKERVIRVTARKFAFLPREIRLKKGEAVLRAYRFFDVLRGDARPWLLSIVRNTFLTWLQINRPADTVGFDDGLVELIPTGDDGPEILAARNFDRKMLNEAIAALPLQFREALIVRELEDLSSKDIARITDVPMATVMSRLARAPRLLAESRGAPPNTPGT